jgi:hypothetical protein
VSLFNQNYNQEYSSRQAGVIAACNKQVWHQLNWRKKSAGSSTADPFISLSDPTTKGKVTHPIGWDRAKAATQKGKGKECLNSQSESSSVIGGIMFTLKKLSTSFTKAQTWKWYNKFWDRSTADMDEETVVSHREALRLIERDLQFVTWNATAVQDEDDK